VGFYSGTKAAMEMLTRAARIELDWRGVFVGLCVLGAIDTPIWEKGMGKLSVTVKPGIEDDLKEKTLALLDVAKHLSFPPSHVSDAVSHALTAWWPKREYLVGWDARGAGLAQRLYGDGIVDNLVSLYYRR